MLERVISRGAYGPEKTALELAEVFGVLTGGQSRRGTASPGEVKRFGLSVDPCSRRQALLANAKRAEGTIVFGTISRSLVRELEQCGRVFGVQHIYANTAKHIGDWIERFGIRTLNIVGEPAAFWNLVARDVMLELFVRLGRAPRLPMRNGCKVIVDMWGIYAVRLWRTPRAWKWCGGRIGWRPVREWDVICMMQNCSGTEWFKSLLPEKVLSVVSVDGVNLDTDLLALVARLGQPMIDLANAGRWAVLRMLTTPEVLTGIPVGRRVIRQLVRCRQRDLVAAFGFPATESAVRTLAKVTRDVQPSTLLCLRNLLEDADAAAAIRHLRRINDTVLYVMSEQVVRQWLSPSCLNEFANAEGLDEHIGLNGIHAQIQRTGIQPLAGSIRSLQDFWRFQRALETAPSLFHGPPPCPPVSLPGLIEPLTTPGQLMDEGCSMQHCVGRYWEEVRSGMSLIFRLLPDHRFGIGRATLMLRLNPTGECWCVSQISGERNQPVSRTTESLVGAWLKHARTSPRLSSIELDVRCSIDLGIKPAELGA